MSCHVHVQLSPAVYELVLKTFLQEDCQVILSHGVNCGLGGLGGVGGHGGGGSESVLNACVGVW